MWPLLGVSEGGREGRKGGREGKEGGKKGEKRRKGRREGRERRIMIPHIHCMGFTCWSVMCQLHCVGACCVPPTEAVASLFFVKDFDVEEQRRKMERKAKAFHAVQQKSFLCAIVCCLPLGIAALAYSVKVMLLDHVLLPTPPVDQNPCAK